MASSTRRPRAMMRAPSDTRWRSIAIYSMTMNTAASTSGIEKATTAAARMPRLRKLTATICAGANAEAEKTHREHDGDRFPQRLGEFFDGRLDHLRLLGDEMRLAADGGGGGGLRPRPPAILPE